MNKNAQIKEQEIMCMIHHNVLGCAQQKVVDLYDSRITDENGYCLAFSISRINVVNVEDLNTIPKEIVVTDVNSYYDVYILDDGQQNTVKIKKKAGNYKC